MKRVVLTIELMLGDLSDDERSELQIDTAFEEGEESEDLPPDRRIFQRGSRRCHA